MSSTTNMLLLSCIALATVVVTLNLLILLAVRLINRIIKPKKSLLAILFACIGVPAHELCHAAVAKIFRYPIAKIDLLNFNREKGYAGQVVISYPSFNFASFRTYFSCIGLYFFGLAPLLFFSLSLNYYFYHQLPNINENLNLLFSENIHSASKLWAMMIHSASLVLSRIFYLDWYFYLAAPFAIHALLSFADCKVIAQGLWLNILVLWLLLFIGHISESLLLIDFGNSVLKGWLILHLMMFIGLIVSLLFNVILMFISKFEDVLIFCVKVLGQKK